MNNDEHVFETFCNPNNTPERHIECIDYVMKDFWEIRLTRVHKDAKIPTKCRNNPGWRLYSCESILLMPGGFFTVHTGISFLSIPKSFAGFVYSLDVSDVSILPSVVSSNAEVEVEIFNDSGTSVSINPGDEIAQIIFKETPSFVLVEE